MVYVGSQCPLTRGYLYEKEKEKRDLSKNDEERKNKERQRREESRLLSDRCEGQVLVTSCRVLRFRVPFLPLIMLSAVAARKKRSQSHPPKQRKRPKKAKDVDRSDDDSAMSIDVTPEQPDQRRAWSPSRLAIDSDANEIPSYSNRPTNEEHDILSTYQPSPDRNMFQLSLDEASFLGLSGPAVALVLFPSETVSLVGTYRLRVLHGSVSLLGAIIRPSQVFHQVFAPSSSPIPVIQAIAAGGESSKSLFDIPARIRSAIAVGNVVIVLQDLQTGVEGLGRVVRTFDGVFHDAQSKGTLVGPLQGVHFVSHAFL